MQNCAPARTSLTLSLPIGSISHQRPSDQSSPLATESGDRKLAVIATHLSEPLAQDAEVDGSAPEVPGDLMVHLDELKTPGDLGESRVSDELPGCMQGAIGTAHQIRKVWE